MGTLRPALLAGAVLALAAAPAFAAGPDGLALSAEDVGGYREVPVAATAAAREIGAGLPASVRRRIGAAPAGASGLRGSGVRALTGVVLLDSPSAARTVVVAWRRAATRSGTVAGVRGATLVTGARSADVLLSSGRAVGLVAVRGPKARARSRAVALARVLAPGLAEAGARTAWDQVLAEVRPDGTVPLATALEAFQIAYRPLPGAPPVSGPPGTVPSGTQVYRWMLRNWSGLTAEQKAVVAQVLAVPAASLGPAPITAAIAKAPAVDWSTVEPSARLDALAQTYTERFNRELGVAMRMGIEIGWFPLGRAAADARPYSVDGRIATTAAMQHTCQVRVARGNGNENPLNLANTVAHEVFHCFQFQISPIGWQRDGNDWLIEGQAEWAADVVAPVPAEIASGEPAKYFGNPRRALFARSYDAGFFWGRLEETTGPIWSRIRPAIDAPTNEAAFAAAGAADATMVDRWASSLLRKPAWDPAWNTDAPISVSARRYPAEVTDAADAMTVTRDPYSNQILKLKPLGERNVIRVEVERGSVRVSDGTTDLPIPGSSEALICVGGRCECKAGDTPALVRMTGPAHLAVSGGTTGTKVELVPVSIDDLCGDPGPEECSTSRRLVMPRTRPEFVAWYRRSSAEVRERAAAIPPFTRMDQDLRRRLDATAGLEPSQEKDGIVESLKRQIQENNGRAFDQSCRFYELVAQGNRVTVRATRLGYLTRSADVARAFGEFNAAWSGAQREHQEDLSWPSRFPPF